MLGLIESGYGYEAGRTYERLCRKAKVSECIDKLKANMIRPGLIEGGSVSLSERRTEKKESSKEM